LRIKEQEIRLILQEHDDDDDDDDDDTVEQAVVWGVRNIMWVFTFSYDGTLL